MNQPTSPQQSIDADEQAESVAQETSEKITGPLTGKAVQPEVPKQPKTRKAASAFRTISEVADVLDVQQHVLRFWETKFSQIRPLKRGGGRRYYRPEDLELLKKIHHLLYTEGYTIKGVQKLLREKGKAELLKDAPAPAQNNNNQPAKAAVAASVKGTVPTGMNMNQRNALQGMVDELKALRALIKPE